MFKNFYTTQISQSHKQLQIRFVKMRSKSGRFSKIMAAVMAMVLVFVMVCVTIVMAATGEDGLEHWDKNEVYIRDGVQFTVNVTGKSVPGWIYEDVSGTDGTVNITITRYQSRDLNGIVSNDHLIELSGEKGTIKLAANQWSQASDVYDGSLFVDRNPDMMQNKKSSLIRFIEFDNEGYPGFYDSPIAGLTKIPEAKNRNIDVHFTFDEQDNIMAAFILFTVVDEKNRVLEEQFDSLKAEDFTFIGNFKEDYTKDVTGYTSSNYYFTMYEDNYKNTETDGIKFEIKEASIDGIILKSDITLSQAAKVDIEVYNENGKNTATANEDEIKPEYTLLPIKIKSFTVGLGQNIDAQQQDLAYEEIDVPENHYVKGEQYRVCAVVFDEDHKVIYRWQEYVTIQ